MGLRVGQRQRRAPRSPEQLPALDAQVRAQPLHVGNQVPGGVGLEAGVRQRAAAAALVEQHDAVARGVVVAPHGGVAAAARPAVHDQHRLAAGVAALLEVDLVASADLQPLLAIGLDRWIEAEPLPCRHRLALPVLVLDPSLATSNGYMRAAGLGKLPGGNVEGQSAGARFLRRSSRISRSYTRLPARHPHVAHDVESMAAGRRREPADDDAGAERQRQADGAGQRRSAGRWRRSRSAASPRR